MNKENAEYAYPGISFRFIKEENPVICYSRMNFEGTMLSEVLQSQKDILHDFSYMRHLKQSDLGTEGMVAVRG